MGGGGREGGLGGTPPVRIPHPSPPQIGVWYSNRTLAMNATTLDINLSQTLANKTLVVTTILVSGPCGAAVNEGAFPEWCPAQSWSGGGMPQLAKHTAQWGWDSCTQQPRTGPRCYHPNRCQGKGGTDSVLTAAQPGLRSLPFIAQWRGRPGSQERREHSMWPRRQGTVSHGQEWSFCHTC